MRHGWGAAAAALVVLAGAAPAAGEEGMWTFDNIPAQRMRADIGWAPDRAWLDRVMAATARLPGCSGATVSADGLVLTNHHCVLSCVQALSSAETDYVSQSFLARARTEEQRCPGMAIQVLAGVEDVTARIEAAVAGAGADGFVRARNGAIAEIEAACTEGARRCEVVTLYHGGRYALYTWRRYEDVRLVFAPEIAAAAFGGDPDNFQFPRYCVDYAFLRLYEAGAPASTPSHLSLRFTPLEEGEIVLAAGNPGSTSRRRAVAEFTFERDVSLPWRLVTLAEARGRLSAFAAQGPEQARIASSTIESIENSFKALWGRRMALADPRGFERAAAAEADLRARVARNAASARDVGGAWDEIAAAQAAYRELFYPYQYLELRAGERSSLFGWARDIVRAAEERALPDGARLPRYSEARLPALGRIVLADTPVATALEQLHLELWLSHLREFMPADDPAVRRVLGGESPQALARRLAQSRLADPAYRRALWEGGAAAVAASDDPMIVFVRSWDGEARAVRARQQQLVEAPMARAHERIARARFQAFGESQYPDATFSPRLTYGRVAGWNEGARVIPPFTRVAGLYERATGYAPYALSPRWLEARERLDGEMIFNVSTTNDVVGGSSGSALIDREGRVVGAVFDGNIHSLGGEYFYDGALNRTVAVASTIIRASLAEIYGAHDLIAELEGQAPSP